MEMLFAHVLNISELRLREDRCLGNILVFDITDAKMSILNAITPMLLKKMYSVGQVRKRTEAARVNVRWNCSTT